MSAKLNNFVAFADTSREPTQDEKFKTFYDIQPEKITYLNIPRREEVKRYREIQKGINQPAEYKQNMLTFILEPVCAQNQKYPSRVVQECVHAAGCL